MLSVALTGNIASGKSEVARRLAQHGALVIDADVLAREVVEPGAPAWEDTIAQFVWGFLFDAVHHRGQLTTYLRPMGGKVPSIYGPSADDPGQ